MQYGLACSLNKNNTETSYLFIPASVNCIAIVNANKPSKNIACYVTYQY